MVIGDNFLCWLFFKTMESEISVPIHVGVTCEQFIREIHPKRCPVILRGNDIGPCIRKWTPEYLSKAVGNKPVKIHVSESGQMNFLTKNFAYKTLAFDQVIKRAAEDCHDEYFISKKEVYYLRSLGNDPRGRDVADFALHFPELHQDLKLPNFLEPSTVFSSVFRVASAGVQLWTHYDVMDNLLIQISGRKRAVLYSPEDLPNLYLDGDKSQVVDIDNPDELQYPLFSRATKYECLMEPGDILFIPALWFHNMTALDFSLAVNVFWRNLQPDFYDKKDPYGNKDPLPASKVPKSGGD
jgi:tRNA wybutosine-synthesizing protein 5